MHQRQNTTNDKPFQAVQFSSLKNKNNSNLITFENNKLFSASNEEGGGILSILGVFHITSSPGQIDQEVFSTMSFQQCPKIYQSFGHQKTMKAFLKIIIENSESQQSLTQLVNEYPILIFVLEAYCRALCISFIKNKRELTGNEKEILENFAYDLRGSMLDIVADCLEMHITLACGEICETYGQQRYNKKVQLCFTETGIQAQFIARKSNISYLKSSQSSALKTIRQINTQQLQTSQIQPASGIQSSSMLKDNPNAVQSGKCQKCRMAKNKCYCSKRILGSTYGTPNSANKFERTSINASLATSIASISSQGTLHQPRGKCTCHKVFCTCSRR